MLYKKSFRNKLHRPVTACVQKWNCGNLILYIMNECGFWCLFHHCLWLKPPELCCCCQMLSKALPHQFLKKTSAKQPTRQEALSYVPAATLLCCIMDKCQITRGLILYLLFMWAVKHHHRSCLFSKKHYLKKISCINAIFLENNLQSSLSCDLFLQICWNVFYTLLTFTRNLNEFSKLHKEEKTRS